MLSNVNSIGCGACALPCASVLPHHLIVTQKATSSLMGCILGTANHLTLHMKLHCSQNSSLPWVVRVRAVSAVCHVPCVSRFTSLANLSE
jgi:hypothetical protein